MAEQSDVVWLDVLPSMAKFAPALAKGADGAADKAGKSAGAKFGKAMLAGTAVVGAGAIAAGKQLYDLGAVFDDVADGIRVGTGATGKELDALVATAKTIGATIPAEFDAIGVAVSDVHTRLGLTGPTLEKVSSQFLQLTNITGEAVNIQQATSAFSAFGIAGEDVSGALDTLYQVSQASGVGVDALTAQLSTNGAVVKQLGLDFGEAAVLVGSLDKAGLNSNQIMASMSRSMVNLSKTGEAPQKAFQRVTGELEKLVKGGKDADAIDLAGKMFGTRGAPQMIAALKSGAVSFSDLTAVAGQTNDTILDAGEDTADFAEHWQVFKNMLSTQLAPVAERVFGIIGDGMAWINANGVPAMQAFVAEWQNGTGVGGKFRDVAVAVGNKLRDLGSWITGTAVPAVQAFIAEWQNGTGRGGEFRDIVTSVADALKAAGTWVKDHRDLVTSLAVVLGSAVVAYQTLKIGMAAYRGVMVGVDAATKAYNGTKKVMLALHNSAIATWVRSTAVAVAHRVALVANRVATMATTGATTALAAVQGVLNRQNALAALGWVRNTAVMLASRTASLAVAAASKVMAAGQWLVNVAMTANPIGLVIAGLVLLGIGFIALWKKSETFRNIVTGAWNGIKTAASAVWDFLLGSVLRPMGNFFTQTIPNAASTMKNNITSHFTVMRDNVVGVWNWIKGKVVDPIVTFFGTTIPNAAASLKKGVTDAFDAIKSATAKPINFVIQTVYNDGLRKAMNLIPGVNLAEAPTIKGYREGGLIKGQFHPRYRDNVLGISRSGVPVARVEPGEMVINREQTKRNYALLQDINAGRLPGLRTGGVAPVPGPGNRHGGYPWATWAGDYPVPYGTPVRAWKDGVVAMVRHLTTSYGSHLRMNHTDGSSSLYAHMSRIVAAVGQRLTAGQTLGYVGSTGKSSGPHLHFETMGGAFNGGSGGGAAPNPLLDLLTSFPKAISNTLGGINTGLTGPWGSLLRDPIRNIAETVKTWGLDKLRDATGVVGDLGSKAITGVKNLFGGRSGTSDDWNAYASGTSWAQPGPAHLGEAGPELVTGPAARYMSGGDRVYSASQTRAILGGGNNLRLIEGVLDITDNFEAHIRGVAEDVSEDRNAAAARWGRMSNA